MRAAREALLFACGGGGIVAGTHLVSDWTDSWPLATVIGAAAGFVLFLTWALDRTGRRLDAQEDRVEDRLEALEERAEKAERMLASLALREAPPEAISAGERVAGPTVEISTVH